MLQGLLNQGMVDLENDSVDQSVITVVSDKCDPVV